MKKRLHSLPSIVWKWLMQMQCKSSFIVQYWRPWHSHPPLSAVLAGGNTLPRIFFLCKYCRKKCQVENKRKKNNLISQTFFKVTVCDLHVYCLCTALAKLEHKLCNRVENDHSVELLIVLWCKPPPCMVLENCLQVFTECHFLCALSKIECNYCRSFLHCKDICFSYSRKNKQLRN